MNLRLWHAILLIYVVALIVSAIMCIFMKRRTKKECIGYLLIDESDPAIDKGGGVYLQLFEAPTKLNDRSIVKIEIRKVNSTKKGESNNG